MLTLYHQGSSVCAAKVRLVLSEKNLQWESKYIDVLKGEQFDPAYLALNPNAVVPTLVHDDLPAMDTSDLRRGRPTCHLAFDEATAILAGDALLTLSFQILTESYAGQPAISVALARALSVAAGSGKLIGGQMDDLLAEENPEPSA